MMFCLEHPKRDQNLKFTLLPVRRRASPHLSYGSPPAPGMNVVTRSLTVTAPQEGTPGKNEE